MDAMHAFVRLVELGSFTAVANDLHIGQSTVSKWLAALEAELGVQLVVRTTRSSRVTQVGHEFYAHAKNIIAGYAEATARMQEATPQPRGRIRVSVPVVFGRMFILPHVARFLRRHPEIEMDLVFDDRYVDLVEQGFDLTIRVGVPLDSTFRCVTVGETPRHVVATPGYLKKHGTPETPRELGAHMCLLHTGLDRGSGWTFRRGTRVIRTPVHGRFAANHSEALLTMTRAGLGIALLAGWLVAADLRRGRLVALLPSFAAPRAPIQVIMPPGRYVHPRNRAFIDFISDALAPLSDRQPVVETACRRTVHDRPARLRQGGEAVGVGSALCSGTRHERPARGEDADGQSAA